MDPAAGLTPEHGNPPRTLALCFWLWHFMAADCQLNKKKECIDDGFC